MSTIDHTQDGDSPYRRDNWWYEDDSVDGEDSPDEPTPTDSHIGTLAYTLLHQELGALTDSLCARSLEDGERIELTDPEFYLPKEHDHGEHIIEYRQHEQPKRVNPETGYISGGESTGVALPEVDEKKYFQAVHNVLARLGVFEPNVDDWLQYAHRLYHDPQYNSKDALLQFIEYKLAYDRAEATEIPS